MNCLHKFIKSSFIILMLLLVAIPAFSAESNINMLTNYFDLVVSGNIESAYYLWTDEARERSSRFGIEYVDIPLKVDCNSPIIRNVELMRDYLQPPVKKEYKLPYGFSVMEYSNLVEQNIIQHKYYARNIDDYHWLTYAQQYYSIGWMSLESEYFRIHFDSSLENQLHQVTLHEADRYVERMGEVLGLTNEDISMIKEKKIEYFFCKSDEQVKEITGHLIKGTLDLPSNDIISAFFPHYHELVHLLVNIKLKKLPLYTLPIVREGLAVHLGGRWGKAPSTLEGIGQFLLSQDMITIESILTMNDFNNNSVSDIAYPVAGLFSGFIIENIGIKEYLDLYLQLSGDFEKASGLTADNVKQLIKEKLQFESWEQVNEKFNAYLDRHVLQNPMMSPGLSKKGKEIYSDSTIRCMEDDEWFSFEVSAVEADTVTGNILFGFDEQLKIFRSILFEEQYKGGYPFEGYRYGIRYDQNEVGVYDYATNHLIAKYIFGLQPDEAYLNEKEHKLYFKFRKEVLDYQLADDKKIKVLPN